MVIEMVLTLAQIRKDMKLTQKELGELIGLTNTAVSMLERGKSRGRIDTWDKLASVLGVDLSSLRRVDPDGGR